MIEYKSIYFLLLLTIYVPSHASVICGIRYRLDIGCIYFIANKATVPEQ